MCYHVSVPKYTEIEELLDKAIRNDEWDTYYDYMNGYNHEPLPTLRMESPNTLTLNNWGLIASWAKDTKHADTLRKSCLNAKGEYIFNTASFKNSIKNKRCLIFLNGFFEWRQFNSKQKYPYFITLKNQKAFACAGVYETWIEKTSGKIIESCAIVTTTANELMAKIHNTKKRMPVILTKQDMYKWIETNLTDLQIIELMQPIDENLLTAYTVQKINPKTPELFNVAEVTFEVEYPEITLFDNLL